MGLFDKEKFAKLQEENNNKPTEKKAKNQKEYTEKTLADVKADLKGLGLIKGGMALSFAKAEEQAKVGYLSALVDQNFIIAKQNEKIIELLSQIANK